MNSSQPHLPNPPRYTLRELPQELRCTNAPFGLFDTFVQAFVVFEGPFGGSSGIATVRRYNAAYAMQSGVLAEAL